MAKDYSRATRVGEQMRRELAELLRMEVKDPRIGFISLTEVEVSPDFAHAKVYFTSMTGSEGVDEILAGLRRELGRRIRIHTTPELHFIYDASIERGAQLSALIDKAVHEDEARAKPADEED